MSFVDVVDRGMLEPGDVDISEAVRRFHAGLYYYYLRKKAQADGQKGETE